MARRIVVTSGKGGVGKTTFVSSLGMMLGKMGYRTLLIDMDFGLNNLDVLMGIENKIVYDIIDVLEGKCQPKQALVQDFEIPNLYTFPSTHGFCKVRFGARELSTIISDLERYFDYVIIDCPAGIDGGFKRAVNSGNEYIVVTTPHLSAVRDADKVIANLKSDNPFLVINRARGDLILDNKMLSVSDITDALNAKLLGVIPEDDSVCYQMITGNKFDEDAPIMTSMKMIAQNLSSGTQKIYDCTKKYKGIFGSFRKNLRAKL